MRKCGFISHNSLQFYLNCFLTNIKMKTVFLILVFYYTLITYVECRYLDNSEHASKFHSGGIVTYWPTPSPAGKVVEDEEKQPGFMKRQLMRFGELASNMENTLGGHAAKITSAIDKICEVVKTVIPVIAAVCHVGQFKFCAASTEGPEQLAQAMNGIDLNIPD
ncbi:unnamed protein product [Acanthoscelides obtectus]|uniref:Uncharacterized protein n=1 Tax=Acanthoscelides obtectus TaxID=200917 RepID=A0A9P0JHZ1_ACAOB|nr:unnamed protein product [Acanthoscelides obtectus]CAK1678811.1 hypothetical protein AOBTE_LOCUS32028 [Acanthoscelides obtectus]